MKMNLIYKKINKLKKDFKIKFSFKLNISLKYYLKENKKLNIMKL